MLQGELKEVAPGGQPSFRLLKKVHETYMILIISRNSDNSEMNKLIVIGIILMIIMIPIVICTKIV